MNALLASLVFLTPSNWFFKFLSEKATVGGILVDYLLVKFTIFDVVLALLTTHIITQKKIRTKEVGLLLLTATVVAIVQLFTSEYALGSMLHTARFAVMGFVFLHTSQTVFNSLAVRLSIFLTALFQSTIVLYQFFLQKSVFGYAFLGETNLHAYAGIAKQVFAGTERIQPYGTTAHPNIIGGVLALLILLMTWYQLRKQHPAQIASIFLAVIALIATQSASAILACILACGALFLKKKFSITHFSLPKTILILMGAQVLVMLATQLAANLHLESSSVTRRAYLQDASSAMTAAHPLFGVGLGEFTRHVEQYSPTKEVVRFVQPVHSGILLLLAEIGVVFTALLLTASVLYLSKKSAHDAKIRIELLLFILPILLWDHYLLTSHTGLSILLITGIWNKAKEL